MARPGQASPDRAVVALKGIVPVAAPLGAAALALFLQGRGLDAVLSGQLGFLPGAPASAPAPALSASAGGAAQPGVDPAGGVGGASGAAQAGSPIAVSAASSATNPALVIDALAVGRYAQVHGASGAWPRRGLVERFRLDAPPRLSAASPALSETGALEAVESARSVLGLEYRALEVLASRLVVARLLAPEEAGTSVEGGVPSQLGDVVLAERPAWLLLFKAEDRTDPPPPGWTDALSSRTLVELLLVDATTGALLLRPPAALFADYESVQLTRHPAGDRSRPLGYFGDAAP